MTLHDRIVESLGSAKVEAAVDEAVRRRLYHALLPDDFQGRHNNDNGLLGFVANSLELSVLDLLHQDEDGKLTGIAAEAFQLVRVLPRTGTPLQKWEKLIRTSCLGVIAERSADVRRMLKADDMPDLPIESDNDNWGLRVWSAILEIWYRLLRKDGWADLEAIQQRLVKLRVQQDIQESTYLRAVEEEHDLQSLCDLVSTYHLARAAEILAEYQTQGSVDGHYDIRPQLEVHFDRALTATIQGRLIERESLTRLLTHTAEVLVDNSLWTATRSVNSLSTKFAESLISPQRSQPLFELLPPQRRVLRDAGLMGAAHRSVVVSLPTSSGKTLIAEFRILQALNQFDAESGWVAYLAPTRALVNQLTLRLRRDFADLGIAVEKLSPALEVDGLEAALLTETKPQERFRLLVATPEKFDMMIRGGWEQRIKRPLTLVVVDEAHGLASPKRGLKLELLLATINRECRSAQFLLLTPFVPNAREIAEWLDPDNNRNFELGMDWVPNDRVIAIALPEKGKARGAFHIAYRTVHTTRNTLAIPEDIGSRKSRPLGLSWSQAKNSPGKLAAAVAHLLQSRGTVIVLVGQPQYSWGVAELLKAEEYGQSGNNENIQLVQQFLHHEMGADFPLISLLDYGIGVHHSGLSEDTRTLIEWLTENGELRVLVATTTIAQGLNFPVSGVVFATHQYPYGQDMPSEDFWNISGRAGRIDQGDLGIIALAGTDENKVELLQSYVSQSVGNLNSTLIDMVQALDDKNRLLHLENLAWMPEWSAFLQYLAHTYRQMDNHEQFALQAEQILRGTLGFRSLRKSHAGWARQLASGVHDYAERLQGKPLKLVDATGFSWETVSKTLRRLQKEGIDFEVWSPALFDSRRQDLHRLMGILLKVPELRKELEEITGGSQTDGNTLTQVVCDWVQGQPLTEMATRYFGEDTTSSSVKAITQCCRIVFGRLTQTASWGLAALQALTWQDTIDTLTEDEQQTLRNLPARVYYGVNSDQAVSLRMLGVPRAAAEPLARQLGVEPSAPLYDVRTRLQAADIDTWQNAMGTVGTSYHHAWSIMSGDL